MVGGCLEDAQAATITVPPDGYFVPICWCPQNMVLINMMDGLTSVNPSV